MIVEWLSIWVDDSSENNTCSVDCEYTDCLSLGVHSDERCITISSLPTDRSCSNTTWKSSKRTCDWAWKWKQSRTGLQLVVRMLLSPSYDILSCQYNFTRKPPDVPYMADTHLDDLQGLRLLSLGQCGASLNMLYREPNVNRWRWCTRNIGIADHTRNHGKD